MSDIYRCRRFVALALLVGCARANACEDDHPPVVTTPAARHLIKANDKRNIIALRLDPRGLTGVSPGGDDPNAWVDMDDAGGAWHYREWQWWKGHPWGDSCRPRYFADVTFQLHDVRRRAEISYRIDGFDCRQVFLLPDSTSDRNAPHVDIVTTIRNASDRDVEEYGHFFACYTPLNRGRSFWFWDESGQLVRFADRGVGHLDGYIAHPQAYFRSQGAIPNCPRGDGKLVGHWHQPVMVSHASPAGWRSVIMIEAEHAASLAQGMEGGAMDYVLFPGPDQNTFANGAEFATHIRHTMLMSPDLPHKERLEELWNEFQNSHQAIHHQAARH
jgi:hypothetical protein